MSRTFAAVAVVLTAALSAWADDVPKPAPAKTYTISITGVG
jgi:hypothetical protein